ncbi:hypothetical protein [Rhodobacter sp. 24-YEA-8]|uniref:hypothetical protein n=1 Tax=Rhodobacter sp. 24-YEA-8 TaxID=1884310 RepID=UPI00115F8940|nr:hypothetical protein [Rhodobacter sp. 24-YEA-8]
MRKPTFRETAALARIGIVTVEHVQNRCGAGAEHAAPDRDATSRDLPYQNAAAETGTLSGRYAGFEWLL